MSCRRTGRANVDTMTSPENISTPRVEFRFRNCKQLHGRTKTNTKTMTTRKKSLKKTKNSPVRLIVVFMTKTLKNRMMKKKNLTGKVNQAL